MLRTLPKRIMTHSATLRVVQETDRWGKPTYKDYKLSKIHVQPTREIVKNAEDKNVNLNSVLFYDPRISMPVINWEGLQSSSELANGQMKLLYNRNEYTVWSIDLLPDDEGVLHHVEVTLY